MGSWTSPSFENGDEDYFDEVPVGGVDDSEAIALKGTKRVSLPIEDRKAEAGGDNKELRRLSATLVKPSIEAQLDQTKRESVRKRDSLVKEVRVNSLYVILCFSLMFTSIPDELGHCGGGRCSSGL